MTAEIIDAAVHPLADGEPPDWASGWGHDRFGGFVEISVGAVAQRLRWVPPGRFTMGSPADEEGRFEDEGPQHEVTIAEGFWLFDTPCTQELWEAVTGENPSRFKSPTRPVEQVSFEDVQRFIGRLNDRVPGLELSLPSEAQWEYACRAGTKTATYAGAMRILGQHNAPVLDEIAWYGGNSGVGFELDEGFDSRAWPEKQYSHERAGTRPVGLKAANPWGLDDMLGNVWEWCADEWHGSYDGAPTDGWAWLDSEGGAANRVVRGGSWFIVARDVRAAYRFHSGPAYRDVHLGFRCARVQVVSAAGTARAGRGKPAQRSERAAATSAVEISDVTQARGSGSGLGAIASYVRGLFGRRGRRSRPKR
jgi:formylglycine-generating enzyme required for sulfatase activity